jgi:hypothetical protein
MLAEALVIFACSNNTGCPETQNQYFLENPNVKHYIDNKTEDVKQFIGPKFVDTVSPFLFIATGGTGAIHIDKHFTLQGNTSGATLYWRLVF